MKLLDTTPERVHGIVLTLRSIVEDELENTVRNEGKQFSPAERLQYLIFQRALGESVQGLINAEYICHQTEEDITQMCEDAGMTVERAIINTMLNNIADVAKHAHDEDEEDTE